MAELNTDISLLTDDPIQTAIHATGGNEVDDLFNAAGKALRQYTENMVTPIQNAISKAPPELSVKPPENPGQKELTQSELNTVKTTLMADEGSKNYVYKDTNGYWTTGVGHLIGDGSTIDLNKSEFKDIERRENGITEDAIKNKGNYLTQDKIDTLFNGEFKEHLASARTTPGWNTADSLQREALVNLDFNMGKWWAKKHKNTVYKKDKEDKFIFDKEGKKIIKHKEGALVWPKARAALDLGEFEKVAKELKNTDYSRTVGKRAARVIKQLHGVGYVFPEHTAETGDTYWNIAQDNGLTLDELYTLNPKARNRPLQVGDEIRIRPQESN